MTSPVEIVENSFDIMESIRKHVAQLKPLFPKRGIMCIGDYSAKILSKEPFVEKIRSNSPIIIQKSSEVRKTTASIAAPQDFLGVDADVDTHFWFNVTSYLAKNENYAERLKNRVSRLHEVVMLVSLWEGLGSALLPTLISQFNASDGNSVALAFMPSRAQSSDAHFNAFASIGMCASNDFASVVLLDRDAVEDYVGVDRNGSRMKGNVVVNYLLEMILAKETFTHELSELSRSFNVKLYTILPVTGASFKVYGSFENMLDAASLNPFLTFDLSSTSVLFVLVRVPLHLKDKLSRGRIELATANWSKRISGVKSIYVSEPVYVDDVSDRVDAVVFAGSFDLTELTAFLHKKTGKIKNEKVKKGLIKEEEWATIVESLSASQ